jgi:hypothetical protein
MPTNLVLFRFDRGRGVGIELQDISVVTGSEFISTTQVPVPAAKRRTEKSLKAVSYILRSLAAFAASVEIEPIQ